MTRRYQVKHSGSKYSYTVNSGTELVSDMQEIYGKTVDLKVEGDYIFARHLGCIVATITEAE